MIPALEALDDWSEASLEPAFEATCVALDGLKLGKLAQPVRVSVTGTGASPGIYETLEVVGQARTIARLRAGVDVIKARVEESQASL